MNLNDLTLEEITEFADNPAIFEKGQLCYNKGAVDQFFMSGKGIKAKVAGNTETYSVEIRTGGGNLSTDCTCAYEGEVCEHIVAVLFYSMLGDPEAEEEDDDDDYEEPTASRQVIRLPVNVLEQLLTGQLDFRDLLGLVAKLENKFARVQGDRNYPMNNVIQFPGPKKMTVAQLKEQVQEFFREVQSGAIAEKGVDDDFRVHEVPDDPNLNRVFDQVDRLMVKEQIDLLWYIVAYGNLTFNRMGTLVGTTEIAEAVRLFAATVTDLELQMPEKQVYLNSLIAAFDWPMFLDEELDLALKEGLDLLCTREEDLHYAIATLETSGLEKNSREWVMQADRILGDEPNFIRLYEENLERVEQYLALAKYWWDRHGDISKYIAILEQWITEQTPKTQDKLEDWAYLYDEDCPYTEQLLTELTEYYYQLVDIPNLYRIFLLWLRIDGLDIELYDHLKSVATELNCWEDCQRQMHLFARDDAEVLARIYLKQKNWDAAISLAQTPGCPVSVKQAIAGPVKSFHPEAAIGLYDQVVHHYIQKKNRTNYQNAAEYVKQIREIYLSILNRPFQWQDYLYDLQQQYQRYRALQEELKKL